MKNFDAWFRDSWARATSELAAAEPVERVLTPEAQADRDDFDSDSDDGCCSCHIAPPCGWCTHPGNPHNQEDDSCWTTGDAA
jgi:hypothetical protein